MTKPEGRVKSMVAEGNDLDLALHIIEFDPRRPEHYLFAAAPSSSEAEALASTLRPDPVPWPAGLAPTPQTITPTPSETDPVPHADVLVVTYTVAEGYAPWPMC